VPNVNTLLREHVVLKYEMVDRAFLNGYRSGSGVIASRPKLQERDQLSWFLCQHRGQEIPRYELLGKMTRNFVAAVEAYAAEHTVPMVQFEKGQRKETVALLYLKTAEREDRYGVVMIGVSQEKANVFRPPAKGQREAGKFAAHRNAAFVKYLYFYIRDRDFGPTFIRFCTYAPFSVRACVNGHQWLIQRLRMSGHRVEPLDNGIAWVNDPEALRRLCRRFSAAHIQRFFDRWLSYLPNPFTAFDRGAEYEDLFEFGQGTQCAFGDPWQAAGGGTQRHRHRHRLVFIEQQRRQVRFRQRSISRSDLPSARRRARYA
jgi:hypothetical protein